MPAKTKPVYEVKIWPVSAAIWANKGDDRTFYNVTVSRSYKDGDEYKASDSFGASDLLSLAKAVDLAHTWIMRQEAKDHQQMSGTE